MRNTFYQRWFLVLRGISCNFVDRSLGLATPSKKSHKILPNEVLCKTAYIMYLRWSQPFWCE
jgi:hypothetical protein